LEEAQHHQELALQLVVMVFDLQNNVTMETLLMVTDAHLPA